MLASIIDNLVRISIGSWRDQMPRINIPIRYFVVVVVVVMGYTIIMLVLICLFYKDAHYCGE